MYQCNRCGAIFSPLRVSRPESCPRCRARDGIDAPMAFAPFSASTTREADDPKRAPGSSTNDEGDEREGTAKM
jgi:hypothetical protein